VFGALGEWFERRRALRELRAIEGRGSSAYSGFFSDQIDVARSEFDQGRREKALETWRKMHAQYPDLCLTSEKAFNLFIDLGNHDEAEALIQEGRRRYPRHKALYATVFARVAYRRGDLEEALRRYDIVRRGFPRVADGYGIAAACFSDLGRRDEAEAMLERGVRTLPNNLDLCIRYAQDATRRDDWPEGLQRWKYVWDRFEQTVGLLGQAECLKEMERLDEAERLLIEACERFHMNPWPFAELANLSTAKGDFDEAVQRWEAVLSRFPWFEFAYPKAAEALRQVGRHTESDEILRVGMTRSPAHLAVSLEYARNAHSRGDWAAATERWALVRERFPDCIEARERELEALAAIER
jgi:tetratricopeptide (TPR) repeat protein